MTPFGGGPLELQLAAVDRLLRRALPDLRSERTLRDGCAGCGDVGCGAISVRIERTQGG